MQATMRPLGFGETLDGAFTLLRRNFSTFFGVALLPQIPIVLFWLFMPAMIGDGANAGVFMAAAPLMLAPYTMFASMLIMGSLTHAAAEAYGGGSPRIRASLGRGLRRFLPILGVTLIAWFFIGVGLLFLIIPGIILMTMYFAIYSAVIIENRGPIDALGRSSSLSKGARMYILGVFFVAAIISYLPVIAMWMVAGASVGLGAAVGAASAATTSLWLTSVMQACSIIVGSVTMPFLITVSVLVYFDRRARTEAPDLESALSALQNTAV